MAETTLRERLVAVETSSKELRDDVKEIKDDVKELLAAWNQNKGKEKTRAVVWGGLSGALSALGAAYVSRGH